MTHLIEDIETGAEPDFINPAKRQKIEGGGLGIEPLMPNVTDTHAIASTAYQNAMAKLRRYIPEDQFPASEHDLINLIMGMMETLNEIKEVENMYTEYLEMLAVNTVLDLPEFSAAKAAVEAGDIKIELTLMAGILKVKPNDMEQSLEDIAQTTEFKSFEDEMAFALADIDQEKLKRRFQNVMAQGAAATYMYLFEYIRDDLNALDPRLSDMYGFMSSVGDLAYWVTPEMDMSGQACGAGEEQVDQEETGEGVIKVKGIIFPLLIHELVKGLVEYTNSHGLPSSPEVAKHVLASVDKNENEPYDLMLGPVFWKKLTAAIDAKNTKLLFHVYNKIISLPAADPEVKESFAAFIKEFLSDPVAAKRMVASFVADIERAIADYEAGPQNESLVPFKGFYEILQEELTNMMRQLMAKYEVPEKEMEQWAAVDPTGIKGINIAAMLNLKKEGKIKGPKDVEKIVDRVVRAATQTPLNRPIPPAAVQQGMKIATSTLPWILKQFKTGAARFPEDLETLSKILTVFFLQRNKQRWVEIGGKKDIFQYATFSDLARDISAMPEIDIDEEEGKAFKRIQTVPGAIKIGQQGNLELIRILPTKEGYNALHTVYKYNNPEKQEGPLNWWCVSNSFSTFINYLSLPSGYKGVGNEPEVQDVNKSYYMVAKDGKPYALFDFVSNSFMDHTDAQARTGQRASLPEYDDIRAMIGRALPSKRATVQPELYTAPPSKVITEYLEKSPKEFVHFLLCRIKHLATKTKSNLLDTIKDQQNATIIATQFTRKITRTLSELFEKQDAAYLKGKTVWATHMNFKETSEKMFNSYLMGPEFISMLANALIDQKNIQCTGEADTEMDKFLISKVNATVPVEEGILSKALGGAAVAGALALSPTDTNAQLRNAPPIIQTQKYSQSQQINIIARTLWAEAREDGEQGMRAVASVAFNRGKGNVDRIIKAIKTPKQFSCWNGMKPEDWVHFKEKHRSGTAWDIANKIATEIVQYQFTPITEADHYYNPQKANPDWARLAGKLRPHIRVGNHLFMSIGSFPIY
jgi:spore germination cell wall hydrolase CwlJ-like protein